MDSIFTNFDSTYGDGYYSGITSSDGGMDIFHEGGVVEHQHPTRAGFHNGDMVFKTVNPVTGVEEIIVNGKTVETHQPNIYGGVDIYHGTELQEQTIPNVHGGVDIYDASMGHEGMTMANVHGGEDYLSMLGNAHTIMSYPDPLIYSAEYRMDPFDIAKK